MPARKHFTCTHPGCQRKHLSSGLCSMHYQRQQKGIDMNKRPHGKEYRHLKPPWIGKGGYVWMYVKGGNVMMQHRYVMEQHLGRKLEAHELVHHRNEDKTDNKIENLYLWNFPDHTSHHRGHRMPCIVCGQDDAHGAHGLCGVHMMSVRSFLELHHITPPSDSAAKSILYMGIGMSILSSEVEDRLRSLKKK